MLIIEDGVIHITRGDDAALNVAITDESGTAYTMQEGDRLIMTVRETPEEASPVIFRTQSETLRLIIVPADTANAEVGRYSADIQLVTADGKITTVFPTLEGAYRYKIRNYKNFVIMPEVTIP